MGKNPVIFLVGTTHTSNKSKKDIEKLTQEIRFDCFLSEGLDLKNINLYNLKNFIKEPFLLIAFFLYSSFLNIFQKDFPALRRISAKEKIPLEIIDSSLQETINYFHRWYNHLVYVLMSLFWLSILLFRGHQFTWSIFLALLFSEFLYLPYFGLKTSKFREAAFVNNTIKLLKGKDFENVLLMCGWYHEKNVRKKLQEVGFEVKTL